MRVSSERQEGRGDSEVSLTSGGCFLVLVKATLPLGGEALICVAEWWQQRPGTRLTSRPES